MSLFDRIQHAARRVTHSLTDCVTSRLADDTPPMFRRQLPPPEPPRRPPAPVDFERIFHGTANQHMRRAVLLPDREWIQYALARGANINGRIGHEGDTVLMQLMRHEPGNAEARHCIDTLMEARDAQGRKADVMLTNYAGDNAMHVLARQPDPFLAGYTLGSMFHHTNGRNVDDMQRALDTPNAEGLTPEQVAEAVGNTVGLESLQGQRRLMLHERQGGFQAALAREHQALLAAAAARAQGDASGPAAGGSQAITP